MSKAGALFSTKKIEKQEGRNERFDNMFYYIS